MTNLSPHHPVVRLLEIAKQGSTPSRAQLAGLAGDDLPADVSLARFRTDVTALARRCRDHRDSGDPYSAAAEHEQTLRRVRSEMTPAEAEIQTVDPTEESLDDLGARMFNQF